jgi:zinc transport system permease protein
MHNFLMTLSFSIIPLITVAIFSLITPPFGATLSLRNEILLGIALPPVGSAIIAAAVVAGVPSDATLLLYCITAAALFFCMIALPLNAGTKRISLRRRELILAGLFCFGNTATMMFMSISPLAEAHFKYLLQGELLAVNTTEVWIVGIFSVLLFAAGTRYRGALYAYALDEEGLFIKEKSYTTITILYRAVATLIITGGIILIGPLLTTSLLIVPAFLCERHSRGLDQFMSMVIGVGFVGAISGFFLAIFVNLPPAPVIVSMVIALGFCVRFLPGRKA